VVEILFFYCAFSYAESSISLWDGLRALAFLRQFLLQKELTQGEAELSAAKQSFHP
jgi:hypothetical protein